MQQLSSNKPSLWWLAITFFKINLVTFGGGYSIISVISRTFVDDMHYLSEEEMLNLVALCPSVPGALAVNATVLVSYRLRGFKGALVAFIGALISPIIIIGIIYYFYDVFKTNPYIQATLNGMRGAVSAVMLYATYTMAKGVFKKNILFSVVMLVGVFLLGMLTDIPTVALILFSGLIGYLYFDAFKFAKTKEDPR